MESTTVFGKLGLIVHSATGLTQSSRLLMKSSSGIGLNLRRSVSLKSVREIVSESIRAEGPYVKTCITGANFFEAVGETNVAVEADNTAIWDDPEFFIPIVHPYLGCDLVFQVYQSGTTHSDIPEGEVSIPITALLDPDGSGDKISYRVMSLSGAKVKGQLIISHKFWINGTYHDADPRSGDGDAGSGTGNGAHPVSGDGGSGNGVAGNDGIAPGLELPDNTISGYARRFGERVAASAFVSACKELICCVVSAVQD